MTTKLKNRKMLIGIIAAIILVLGLVCGSITIAGNTPGRRADRYLNLGGKYLSELDYEQALVAYRQVLEIEPKNLAAYRGGLAAYEGLGNRDGMAEFYTDALDVIERLPEEDLKPVYDTAVEIYLYAGNVYPEDHAAATKALERGYDTLGGEGRLIRELIKEYGILAGAYIDAGDYEKEQEIYQRIVERNLENADALSAWEPRVRERFQEYLSKNSGCGNAPEATQKPMPEPTVEPTPRPTAEPTPEPTPESTPEPVRYVEEILFTYSADEYEEYGYAYGGSIPLKKDGKWGAVDYENNVIVPFEYDGYEAGPDYQGRFTLYKAVESEAIDPWSEEPLETKECFLFDNQGKIVYQGFHDWMGSSGGMYITCTRDGDGYYARVEHHSMDGSVLATARMRAGESQLLRRGFYNGICYVGAAYGGPDDIGAMDLQGNITWRDHPVPLGDKPLTTPISTINHGYYVLGEYGEWQWAMLLVYDERDNQVADFAYYEVSVDENGKVSNEYSEYNGYGGYWGYYVDGFYTYNYGSEMVFSVGEKDVLMDFARNTKGPEGQLDMDEIVLAVYDRICMADEKYWSVQSGEKWGYIDHEGNEMAMFEDAGSFWKGYALVKEDGEAWLIDENFQKLQNLGAADSVYTAGEIYTVELEDKVYYYRLINQ